MQWLAIAIGAGLGACLRAWLAQFNTKLLHIVGLDWLPLGTLIANVLGGFLIGIAMVIFEHFADSLHPHIKMMIVTGFLGGLTTFSTFSNEVFSLLNTGRVFAGFGLMGTHVFLTLSATAIGFYLMKNIIG